ncbi:HEPN domain-containing protein [Candidatus Pyrohabitans sp.]
MPEWDRYLERAEEALSSAKILLEAEKYNSAISEGYYAQYYAAKALLSIKNIQVKKHRGVLAKLGFEFVNRNFLEETYLKAYAKSMRLREKADYDVYFTANREEAESVIEEAEEFINRIRRLINDIK